MNEDATVSESETGQNQPPPSREERDEAYSSGAGRKAAEIEIPEDQLDAEPENQLDPAEEVDDSNLSAPVGLQMETDANAIDMEL